MSPILEAKGIILLSVNSPKCICFPLLKAGYYIKKKKKEVVSLRRHGHGFSSGSCITSDRLVPARVTGEVTPRDRKPKHASGVGLSVL